MVVVVVAFVSIDDNFCITDRPIHQIECGQWIVAGCWRCLQPNRMVNNYYIIQHHFVDSTGLVGMDFVSVSFIHCATQQWHSLICWLRSQIEDSSQNWHCRFFRLVHWSVAMMHENEIASIQSTNAIRWEVANANRAWNNKTWMKIKTEKNTRNFRIRNDKLELER